MKRGRATFGFYSKQSKLYASSGVLSLECGSGATSIIAGVLGERLGFDVYCLEQDQAWSKRVRRTLDKENLRCVRVIDTRLVRYPAGEYVWYDLTGATLPTTFGAVICDGPAILPHWGDPYQQAWRRGLMPFLSGRAYGAVLLDDFDDQRATSLTRFWIEQFGVSVTPVADADGAFAVIKPGSSDTTHPSGGSSARHEASQISD